MRTILKHLISAVLLLVAVTTQAATTTPEMQQALQEFVAAQDLNQAWSALLGNASKNRTDGMLNNALTGLNDNKSLNEAQRDKARKMLRDLVPQITEEITAYYKSLDAEAMVMEMAQVVYVKYYNVQEIRDLTTFYGSSAFKKITAIGIAARAESQRTGESTSSIMQRHDKRFTVEEKRFLTDFNNSATGKKHAQLSMTVRAESLQFLDAKFMQGMEKILYRYGEIVTQRLKEIAKE